MPDSATVSYQEFLESKAVTAPERGYAGYSALNPSLKPHARDIAAWMIRGGNRACFASFGLHKTSIQLQVCESLLDAQAGPSALIVCPLGVRREFKKEQIARGFKRVPVYIRTNEEYEIAAAEGHQLFLTNYERIRDGQLDPNRFAICTLDEAAVLRSFGSKTYQTFLPLFNRVPYKFVATATPSPNRYKELIHYAGFLGIMDTGQALAQPTDAKILTTCGWKPMGEILLGDSVIGQDGHPTEVIGVFPQGEKPVFRVSFSDGSSTECTGEHLWLTRTQYERNNEKRYSGRNGPDAERCGKFATIKTTAEIAESLLCQSTKSKNHQIPVVQPVQMCARTVAVDPYLMGALLGDGHIRTTSVSISSADDFIVEEVRRIVERDFRLAVTRSRHVRKNGAPGYDYAISNGLGKGSGGGRGHFSNGLLNGLKSYGLLEKRSWNKRIPPDYLWNSAASRLAVLQGLMDTDGTVSDPPNLTVSFLTTSEGLAEDVCFLVRSLGGIATTRQRQPHPSSGSVAGRKVQGWRTQYLVTINLNGMNPFRLPRKAERVRLRSKYFPTRYITSVEPTRNKECQCIAVASPDRLYVTDDFIVTHNTRFFKRDSSKAGNLKIHPHKLREFWLWVSTWATFITKPSDLGYSDEGYILPPLNIIRHRLPVDYATAGYDSWGQGKLIRNAATSLSDAAREKRDSLGARVQRAREIIEANPDENYIIWCELEDERRAIEKAIPGVECIWGSQDIERREEIVERFAEGELKRFGTKFSLSGSGSNFQDHCHINICLGLGYKFADFIQGCHRTQRFGQKHIVDLHLIYTESEDPIHDTLMEKWKDHNELHATMAKIIQEFGLNQAKASAEMHRSIGVQRQKAKGDLFTTVNNDNVAEMANLPDASVDLIVTSWPFSTHYEYVDSYNDFGHNDGDTGFFAQMEFLTPELSRVLKPGRMYCVHAKDRIVYGSVSGDGMYTVNPFSDKCVAHLIKHGLRYCGRITVATDVVRENNQTYRLGHSENAKDGTKMGVGSPEYILLFRKLPTDQSKGYADVPVPKKKPDCLCSEHTWGISDNPDSLQEPTGTCTRCGAPYGTTEPRPVPFTAGLPIIPGTGYGRSAWQIDAHSFWRSNGNRFLTPEEIASMPMDQLRKLWHQYSKSHVYDFGEHVQIAEEMEKRGILPSSFMALDPPNPGSPWVWDDVARMKTLNTNQGRKGWEAHVCPLQIDVVERLIERFCAKGELVLDPFSGLGTVPYTAVLMGRRGYGIELNEQYWRDSVSYCKAAEQRVSMPTLFDMEEQGA